MLFRGCSDGRTDCRIKQSEGRRADESRRASGVVRALVRGAEHQRLVDVAKSVNLRFGGFESEFQLLLDGLEIPNVSSCCTIVSKRM